MGNKRTYPGLEPRNPVTTGDFKSLPKSTTGSRGKPSASATKTDTTPDHVADNGESAGEASKKSAYALRKNTIDLVTEKPVQSLVIAFGAGAILAALIGS